MDWTYDVYTAKSVECPVCGGCGFIPMLYSPMPCEKCPVLRVMDRVYPGGRRQRVKVTDDPNRRVLGEPVKEYKWDTPMRERTHTF